MENHERSRDHDEEASFRSFWKGTIKKAIAKPLTFVQHGPKGADQKGCEFHPCVCVWKSSDLDFSWWEGVMTYVRSSVFFFYSQKS